MMTPPILVVDDEPEMRLALSHALGKSGYAVETASNGREALEKVGREKFRMVITDLKMPEISGMEVLRGVRKISSCIPVIMITGYGTVSNAVEAMKEGASDFLLKPFCAETLDVVVKKACGNVNGKNIPENFPVSLNKHPENKRIITQDANVLKMLDLAKSVASSKATILIQGESGTGKELFASFIHAHSGRYEKPYIAVNCASLPEGLAESEFFGHEKGSFTGALCRKVGKFELAHQGTLVLDEISEMALPLQAKLLRVLQEKEIDRVGGTKAIPIDVRIIAVSNVDLKKAVKKGKFREDLFYRLNVIPFTIPPLRERKSDIALVANYFLEKYSFQNNKKMKTIAEETVILLMKYDWKGNVRELENTIERAVLLGKGDILLPRHLFLEESECEDTNFLSFQTGISLRQMEKEMIYKTLKEVNGNRTHAAKLLGISIRTLRNKLREYKEDEIR
jgi:DNA-binding NtrC family response regulator